MDKSGITKSQKVDMAKEKDMDKERETCQSDIHSPDEVLKLNLMQSQKLH